MLGVIGKRYPHIPRFVHSSGIDGDSDINENKIKISLTGEIKRWRWIPLLTK